MIDLQLDYKIKNLAKEKNISIRQLCIKIEMTEQGFSRSLTSNTLKIETLQKIADVLNVSVGYFFGIENDDCKKIIIEKEEYKKIATKFATDYMYAIEKVMQNFTKQYKDKLTYNEVASLIYSGVFKDESVKLAFKIGLIDDKKYLDLWNEYKPKE